MKRKKIPGSIYFLIVILSIYLYLFIFNSKIFNSSLIYFEKLMLKILPILFFVFILMVVSNILLTPKFVQKHLKDKGIKKWIFIIIGGVLSVGPIYIWYPLLKDLKGKGLSYGLISCFLYNRSIKLQMIPVALFYFSWQFLLILGLTMIFVSVIQGLLINYFLE